MTQGRRTSIDLNTMLAGANLLVMGLNLAMLGRVHGHPYIDENSIALGGLLALQTQAALLLERRRRDPLVVLLAFIMVFFYSARIFTLAVFSKSVVFSRFAYEPADTNFALIIIVLANTCLYAGLFLVRSDPDREIDSRGWRPSFPAGVTLLLILSLAFAYSMDRFWTTDNVPRVFMFLSLIISQNILVLMVFAYLLLFRKSLSRFFIVALIALILVEVVLHLLSGSRSAMTGLIQNYMLVALAIAGAVKIERRYALLGLALTPVLAGLLVWGFVSSSFIRASRGQGAVFDPLQAVELAQQRSERLSEESAIDIVLAPVFARVGYLDFSAELIANRERYREVVNVPTYFRSIIDNLLTPGFDVFDQPKVSNSLRFVYQGLGKPSKMSFVEKYGYQSDQLGLYGELYLLFGFASLPLFFVFAYVTRRIYVGLRRTNPFSLTVKRIVVLTVFLTTINSYGLDWVITETVPFIIVIVIYRYVFAVERLEKAAASREAVRGFPLPSIS